MARIPGSELQALNAKYNAAHLAYRTAARARSQTTAIGTDIWDMLVEAEAAALRELNAARAEFLAALAHLARKRLPTEPSTRRDEGRV
jgi:hypothetical protein